MMARCDSARAGRSRGARCRRADQDQREHDQRARERCRTASWRARRPLRRPAGACSIAAGKLPHGAGGSWIPTGAARAQRPAAVRSAMRGGGVRRAPHRRAAAARRARNGAGADGGGAGAGTRRRCGTSSASGVCLTAHQTIAAGRDRIGSFRNTNRYSIVQPRSARDRHAYGPRVMLRRAHRRDRVELRSTRCSSATRSLISSARQRLHALGAEVLDVEGRQRRAVGHRAAQQLVGISSSACAAT